jgi:hypothetical protein
MVKTMPSETNRSSTISLRAMNQSEAFFSIFATTAYVLCTNLSGDFGRLCINQHYQKNQMNNFYST